MASCLEYSDDIMFPLVCSQCSLGTSTDYRGAERAMVRSPANNSGVNLTTFIGKVTMARGLLFRSASGIPTRRSMFLSPRPGQIQWQSQTTHARTARQAVVQRVEAVSLLQTRRHHGRVKANSLSLPISTPVTRRIQPLLGWTASALGQAQPDQSLETRLSQRQRPMISILVCWGSIHNPEHGVPPSRAKPPAS